MHWRKHPFRHKKPLKYKTTINNERYVKRDARFVFLLLSIQSQTMRCYNRLFNNFLPRKNTHFYKIFRTLTGERYPILYIFLVSHRNLHPPYVDEWIFTLRPMMNQHNANVHPLFGKWIPFKICLHYKYQWSTY